MTEHSTIWACAAALTAGSAAGAAHFAALRWNARYFAVGRLGVALGAQAVRCVLTALLLFALARAGIPALLTGMAGLLLARHVVLRQAVRT
ncbi:MULTISPECIES: ATP synthase subunit I [unclassified Paraburkholderia]|uniref:N-ATPase subunit AtpR n=1 Tax=unclassified Paraburkholderia TaxID=2615204 RepID=UPI002AB63C45|nr:MULTISPECIES: ATP synthase subunit I [unclassified Paraburkholderia]